MARIGKPLAARPGCRGAAKESQGFFVVRGHAGGARDNPGLKRLGFPGMVMAMETTPFELTPEQKGMLASLSRETGKPIPALIAQALEDLQEHERLDHEHGTSNGHETTAPTLEAQETCKPIWEQFADAFNEVPEEELARLPTDLAAQVDHYVYGLPKRPA